MNRNWLEDFDHENGKYMNTCVECRADFMGHKRRVICKICVALATANATISAQPQWVRIRSVDDLPKAFGRYEVTLKTVDGRNDEVDVWIFQPNHSEEVWMEYAIAWRPCSEPYTADEEAGQ